MGVLLDEASANIDAGTDAAIQGTIRGSFGTSTLMIIAHRLSTIADSDLIVCGLTLELHRNCGKPVVLLPKCLLKQAMSLRNHFHCMPYRNFFECCSFRRIVFN